MKILLDIKDEKAPFILELLKNYSFVKAKSLTENSAQLMEDIKESVQELALIRAGKKKAQDAEDFLNEL
jgi:hypothetical protein